MGMGIRTSTTVSETLGEGTTENVHIIRSGYSSRIFEIRRVPIPAPVPPPREWVIWKPIEGLTRSICGVIGTRTLKAVRALGLLAHNVEHSVNELRALSVICKKAYLANVTRPRTRSGLLIETRHATRSMRENGTHGPWPSCYPHRSGRRRSCPGGKGHQADRSGQSPWYRAPSRPGSRAARTCSRRSRCSKPRCARAAGRWCPCRDHRPRYRARRRRLPRTWHLRDRVSFTKARTEHAAHTNLVAALWTKNASAALREMPAVYYAPGRSGGGRFHACCGQA